MYWNCQDHCLVKSLCTWPSLLYCQHFAQWHKCGLLQDMGFLQDPHMAHLKEYVAEHLARIRLRGSCLAYLKNLGWEFMHHYNINKCYLHWSMYVHSMYCSRLMVVNCQTGSTYIATRFTFAWFIMLQSCRLSLLMSCSSIGKGLHSQNRNYSEWLNSELAKAIRPRLPHVHTCICIYVHTYICMYVCK